MSQADIARVEELHQRGAPASLRADLWRPQRGRDFRRRLRPWDPVEAITNDPLWMQDSASGESDRSSCRVSAAGRHAV